ncbi:putative LRR containing protein [Trachipleistophora hominis]|uniref:Putative LRR containing protein n=1 Tax=Trachipleistophora hominis TaxID=72359 RepID=L7JZI4_TRAHO|nr:putative LRR containing protein [Trachipleistophora hominis]
MWSNLYKYIDAGLKYIFLFENEDDFATENFIITENPEDLQMPGLWTVKQRTEMVQSITNENGINIFGNNKLVENLFSHDHAYYYNYAAGIRKIFYQTHQDVIDKNTNIQFKVINVPMSFSLYAKIIKLSIHCTVSFTIREIREILKHYTRFEKNIMILLLKHVCEHFLKDKTLLQKIQMYRDHPSDDPNTSSIMSIFLPFFDTEEAIYQFKMLVRLHIVLLISNGNKICPKLCSRSLLCQHQALCANHDAFALLFFFDKLEIYYEWFINNKNLLDTVFKCNMIDSSYAVSIYGSMEKYDSISDANVCKEILDLIQTSEFLQGTVVSELTLEFDSIHENVEIACLASIRASITAQCTECSLDFIQSIPEYIKITVSMDNLFSTPPFNISHNVTNMSFNNCNFDYSLRIPNNVESVYISDCTFNTNETLTLSERCKNVQISSSKLTFIFPNVIEFDMRSNTERNFFLFEFKINRMSEKEALLLDTAIIYKTISIDRSIESLAFVFVTIVPESCVTFNEATKYLTISQSEGLFDMRPYIGVMQHFKRNMTMKISPLKTSLHKLSEIILLDFELTETVQLSNIYESVVLNRVFMTENTEIILNKACKKLEINNSTVVINAWNVETIEHLFVRFSLKGNSFVKFVGLRRVNYVHLFNICLNVNSFATWLTGFESIKHLIFDNNHCLDDYHLIDAYYKNLMSFISTKESLERNPGLLRDVLAVRENKVTVLVYRRSNIIINYYLKHILNCEVMKKVSKLEFIGIAINSSNCNSFRNLKNLKALQLSLEKIDNKFLYNLPPNLKLLRVTDLFNENLNLRSEYTIKPSIIVQPHINLKILSVHVDFLYNLCFMAVSMPPLEILEVQYSRKIKIHSRVRKFKIKVRELFVQCKSYKQTYDHEITLTQNEMISFMKSIESHVEFEFLECVDFVFWGASVIFDPKTLRVV